SFSDLPRHCKSIHTLHLSVEENAGKWVARTLGRLQSIKCLRTACHANGTHTLMSQYAVKRLPVRLVIVDHKHGNFAQQPRLHGSSFYITGRLHRQIDDEVERTSLTGRAFYPDAAVHHVHQASADGQAQASATVFPCSRAISLRKSLKDSL